MRRLLLIACAVLAVSGAASAVWLGTRGDGHAREAIVPVDERDGALRGVRFGDTAAEIRARLGETSDDEDGFFPANTDFRAIVGDVRVLFGEDPIESITLTRYAPAS